MTHHVIPVLELRSLTHDSILQRLGCQDVSIVLVLVLSPRHRWGLRSNFIPFNLELCHSGLLCQDVSCELGDVRDRGWVFIELRVLIVVVDIIAHPEELLIIVGASEKDRRDPNQVRRVNLVSSRRRPLGKVSYQHDTIS